MEDLSKEEKDSNISWGFFGFELAEVSPFLQRQCSCGEIAEGMPRIIRLQSVNQKINSFRASKCLSPRSCPLFSCRSDRNTWIWFSAKSEREEGIRLSDQVTRLCPCLGLKEVGTSFGMKNTTHFPMNYCNFEIKGLSGKR